MTKSTPHNVLHFPEKRRDISQPLRHDPTDWWIDQGTAQYEAAVRCLTKHASKAYLRELLLQTLEECRNNEAAS